MTVQHEWEGKIERWEKQFPEIDWLDAAFEDVEAANKLAGIWKSRGLCSGLPTRNVEQLMRDKPERGLLTVVYSAPWLYQRYGRYRGFYDKDELQAIHWFDDENYFLLMRARTSDRPTVRSKLCKDNVNGRAYFGEKWFPTNSNPNTNDYSKARSNVGVSCSIYPSKSYNVLSLLDLKLELDEEEIRTMLRDLEHCAKMFCKVRVAGVRAYWLNAFDACKLNLTRYAHVHSYELPSDLLPLKLQKRFVSKQIVRRLTNV